MLVNKSVIIDKYKVPMYGYLGEIESIEEEVMLYVYSHKGVCTYRNDR